MTLLPLPLPLPLHSKNPPTPLNRRNLLRPSPLPRQTRPSHKPRNTKTNRTLILPLLPIPPKLKTSPTNSMPTPRKQYLFTPLTTNNTRITEMSWELDLRILHAAFDFRGEFFSFFDPCAEEMDFGAQGFV